MNYDGLEILDNYGNLATLSCMEGMCYKVYHYRINSGITWTAWEIKDYLDRGIWKLPKSSVVKLFIWENALLGKR